MSVNYTKLDSEQLEYIIVAETDEIPSGERIFLDIDDHSLVVFNIAGKYFAIADVCSHDDGPLGDGELATEFEISCPRHGARFDIRSGEVKSFPASLDIPAYPVRVNNGKIEVGIPIES
jgi:3-phenylpropionate/trans-cinnamate dioxygenase ferredoxin subunit